ncbi:MAG: Type 1 glutamine amidotransferase-like domain-containing protein [Candidatus Paceibacterota bacterium]
MKFLLTSGGITNKKIADALLELVGKPAGEINLAYVPTAANANRDNKTYLIKNLIRLNEQGFKMIDIVDISALPKWNWLPRFEAADILFFEGGDSSHLMRWIEESGLKEALPELLKTRVWVGSSAGSIVLSPTLALSNKERALSYKERFGYEAKNALGLVDFYFRPHLNSPSQAHSNEKVLAEIAKTLPGVLYALDDQMAIKVVNGKVEIIGEGEYLVFNK